jgi:hypothetical protein
VAPFHPLFVHLEGLKLKKYKGRRVQVFCELFGGGKKYKGEYKYFASS